MLCEIQPTQPSNARFFGDYFRTFVRLLDPNLPSSPSWSRDAVEASCWSASKTLAFATICLLAAGALLAEIMIFCA